MPSKMADRWLWKYLLPVRKGILPKSYDNHALGTFFKVGLYLRVPHKSHLYTRF